MSPTDIMLAKQHNTHLLHHPNCSYCVTEKGLGGRPKLQPYDSPLLRTVKSK